MKKKQLKKLNINTIKKSFNKVRYKGKKQFNLTNKLFKQLITSLMRLSFRQRRMFKQNIYKKLNRFKLNRRFFFGNLLRKNIKIIKYFFFFFSCTQLIINSYGKMLSSHLEIIRRKFRQNLNKEILIEIYIKPYKILLKRPSQVRMGGGKAAKIQKIIYPIYPGLILLKISGGGLKKIKKLFYEVCFKLPFKLTCICLSRI